MTLSRCDRFRTGSVPALRHVRTGLDPFQPVERRPPVWPVRAGAARILSEMTAVAAGWREHFAACGVTVREMEELRYRFVLAEG